MSTLKAPSKTPEKTAYIVTDKAGPQVAGRAVSVGATIELTEAEARYERLLGAITPAASVTKGVAKAAKAATKSTAEAGAAEAAAVAATDPAA